MLNLQEGKADIEIAGAKFSKGCKTSPDSRTQFVKGVWRYCFY